jgi:hypothetical protein
MQSSCLLALLIVSCLLVVIYARSPFISSNQKFLSIRGGGKHGLSVLQRLLSSKGSKISTNDTKKKIKRHTKDEPIQVQAPKKKELTQEELQKIDQRQQLIISTTQTILTICSLIATRYFLNLDYQQPKLTKIARIVFVSYLLLSHLLYAFLKLKIAIKNDETLLVEENNSSTNPLTLLVEFLGLGNMSNHPFGALLGQATNQSNQTTKPLSIKEYDLMQNKRIYNSLFFELILVSYLHFIRRRHSSLLIAPFMGIVSKLKEPLLQIHLFGFYSIGDIKRPFQSALVLMMKKFAEKKTSETSMTEPVIETSSSSIESSIGSEKSIEVNKSTVNVVFDKVESLEVKEEESWSVDGEQIEDETEDTLEPLEDDFVEENTEYEDNSEIVDIVVDEDSVSQESKEIEDLIDSLDAIDPFPSKSSKSKSKRDLRDNSKGGKKE